MFNRSEARSFKTSQPSTSASPAVREIFRVAQEKKVSQNVLADNTGLCNMMVWRYKYGRSTPSIMWVEEAAKFLALECRVSGARR